jgi:diguanylate cyclase (GGDEF)-like protein
LTEFPRFERLSETMLGAVALNRNERHVSGRAGDAAGPAAAIGEREGPSLNAIAEAELSRTEWNLAFPSALETRYQSDTEAERVRELKSIVRLGAVLYLVGGVVVKPLLTVPAPWPVSVLQLGGVTASLFVLSQRFFRIGTPGVAREAALLACCLISTIAAFVALALAHLHGKTDDFIADILPVNFVLIFVPLRFPSAVAFLILTFGAFATTIFASDPLAGRGAYFLIGIMAALCLPALVGVRMRERATRRLYLHGLLQTLRNERLARENTILADLTLTDPLTRMANRRRLDAELTAFCGSPGAGGALLLIDIDRFKDFNDRLGHLGGDECLRQIAARLSMHLRRPDLLARFGGEEFAVLLPQVSSDEATQMAERLRKAVSAQPFLVDGQGVSLTVSIGVAVRGRGCDPDGLIAAADRALYAAKNSGRDQVKAAAVAA